MLAASAREAESIRALAPKWAPLAEELGGLYYQVLWVLPNSESFLGLW